MSSHDTVAHAWAYQTGRNRRGFNMFYEGATIYSYGHHFPIARLVTAPNGANVVLFTTDGRSVSTAKHKTIVWRAVADRELFHVPQVSAGPFHETNHADYIKRIGEALERAARARKYADDYIATATRLADEANRYSAVFGLGLPVVTLPADVLAEAHERVARAKAAEREASRKRDADDALTAKEWIAGSRDHIGHTRLPFVRVKGNEVQTSWGVRVPLEDALPLFHLAERCAADRREFVPSRDVLVGPYRLTRISAEGTIQAGCHVIPLARAQAAASRLLPVVLHA